MRKSVLIIILILILVSAAVFASQLVPAIPWWSVDGGAETSTGGGFVLSGIIGQPDAGPAMTDGTYTVTGGYWHAAHKVPPPEEWFVYLPLAQK